ncbi:MAG: hypothetical protein AAGF12_35090 [Myxococcota bacterium]
MRADFLFAGFAVLVLLTGCARETIPNTDVADTSENREVLEFVEQYREALMERDSGALIRLADPEYLDDNGTPSANDDIDYEILQERLLTFSERILDVRYDIRYRRVTFTEADRVYVDYTYSGNFKVVTAEGERWSRRLADNRLILARREDGFRILSGM